jgi:hypothetical protein
MEVMRIITGAYGSDEDSDEVETVPVLPVPHQGFSGMSLPLPQGHSAGASEREPDAKPARRTFQLPLPALKNSAAVKTDSESSDDEDAKRFAASRKGGGLLASVSTPLPSFFASVSLLSRCCVGFYDANALYNSFPHQRTQRRQLRTQHRR